MMSKIQRFNWLIWAGFLLSLAAFLSYLFFFVNFPVTRDFPWANLILFGLAAALLFFGVRRAFASGRSRLSKIAGSVLATLSLLVFVFFVYTIFIAGRQLPASAGAPQVGQQAPEFILADASGKQVSLEELLSTPINGKAPKGVLLVFYRGYW